jgi:hypothetical protein
MGEKHALTPLGMQAPLSDCGPSKIWSPRFFCALFRFRETQHPESKFIQPSHCQKPNKTAETVMACPLLKAIVESA